MGYAARLKSCAAWRACDQEDELVLGILRGAMFCVGPRNFPESQQRKNALCAPWNVWGAGPVFWSWVETSFTGNQKLKLPLNDLV